MSANIPDVKPGTVLDVKIVKAPSNRAAVKTLQRILAKDPAHARVVAIDKKVRERNTITKQRGGRMYSTSPTKLAPVKGIVGESGKIKSDFAVLEALRSVARFVEVKPA
ncbi:MAG: hypothetical protein GC162_15090 [Planctomycetes bacterium]|nr:hypothetical protein [Planctomycetota bacterium]